MSSISLPIFGQGSQPQEEDGASLEYMAMPQEMMTYTMPRVSDDLKLSELNDAQLALLRLLQQLSLSGEPLGPLDLTALDDGSRRFIDEVLGEGEVSAICSGEREIRVQESVLAGVWRLRTLNDAGQIVNDRIEVGAIPSCLKQSVFSHAAAKIDTAWDALPEGVMNAPPLLTELNAKIGGYRPGDDAYVINLSLLPQTEQDLAFLSERLGAGNATILSRGYGNCRITATATNHVWWVQYYNSEDKLILNTLEVSEVPSVACASPEDIADSHNRLEEILKVYL